MVGFLLTCITQNDSLHVTEPGFTTIHWQLHMQLTFCGLVETVYHFHCEQSNARL